MRGRTFAAEGVIDSAVEEVVGNRQRRLVQLYGCAGCGGEEAVKHVAARRGAYYVVVRKEDVIVAQTVRRRGALGDGVERCHLRVPAVA